MPLPIGTRVGPYIIDAPIGAGGMGEVYKARDARLNRDVAIKVLPDLFSRDPDRLARFEREAQAVAALSHPGILAIHDFGTSGQTTYAVMELLEGETLRERLAPGPLPPRKAVEYAVQIARALAAAHDRGIIHRDLKPENLFITADDRAKILDFGLARQVPAAVVGDQTYSPDASRQTTPGTVLGTMGYMSPEQARGEAGDQRSDIFAFGAVLYEMVTGRRAFTGNTPAETISAVLRDEPADPLTVATSLPPAVARIIWHCLEKKPETRFRSAHDLAFALETVTGVSSSPMPASEGSGKRARLGSWRTAAAVAAIAAIPLVFWLGRRTAEPGGVSAPNIQPKFTRLTFDQGRVSRALFAPDGHTILYSAKWLGQPSRLFLTRVDQPGATRLSVPESSLLAIAPSGELAIRTDQSDARSIEPQGTLALSPMLGGSPRAMMERVTSANWNATGQLAVVRVDGGRQRLESPPGKVLYETDGEIGWPRFSPSGDLIAFLDWPVKDDDRGAVNVITLAGERRKISDVWEGVRGLAWSPNGNEVWFTGSTAGGGYELHATNVQGSGGRLIYRAPGNLLLHDVQKDGKALLVTYGRTIRAGVLFEGESSERDLSLFEGSFVRDISPDGRTVVMSYFGAGSINNYAVYTRGVDASVATLIGEGEAQQFSPDGKWVLSVAHGPPVRVLLLPTGVGQARTVSTGAINVSEARWLPDGRRIVAIGSETGRGSRAYVMEIDRGSPRAISPEGITFESNMLAVAPDGSGVILRAPDGRVMAYPVEQGGTPSPVPGLAAREMPIAWTADSKSVLVVAAGQTTRIDRIDRTTGRRDGWLELRPPEQELLDAAVTIAIARNSRSYVANYQRIRTTLFLVDGLR